MAVLGGKIGEGVVRYWPQRTRSYFSGFLRLCQFWWKSIKKCDRESAHRRTDTQTDRHTDANRFYNLPHAICYSYGTDKNKNFLHRGLNPPQTLCSLASYTWKWKLRLVYPPPPAANICWSLNSLLLQLYVWQQSDMMTEVDMIDVAWPAETA